MYVPYSSGHRSAHCCGASAGGTGFNSVPRRQVGNRASDAPFTRTREVRAGFGETMMLTAISRTWWLAALRGSLAILFGAAAFVWPGLTFDVLVLLFGAYAFVDGVVVLSFGLMAAGEHGQWWPLVVGGLVGLAIGVVTFVQPAATALALVYVI